MDWSRFRYRTACRFFRDSDTVGQITWYPAAPNAVVLPFDSAINCLEWTRDGDLPTQNDGVGEVGGAPRTISHMGFVPGAIGQHQCGTRRDFEEGGEYDPDRHVEYRPDGLPVCCPGGVGGLLLGGPTLPPPLFGGLDIGGGTVAAFSNPYYVQTNDDPHYQSAFKDVTFSEGWTYYPTFGLKAIQVLGPQQLGAGGEWQVNLQAYPPLIAWTGTYTASGYNGQGYQWCEYVSGDGPPGIWITNNASVPPPPPPPPPP